MTRISKYNKDNDYENGMAWHEYLSTTNNSKVVGMTWISKHNKDDYYNNKVVGMVWY